MRSGRGTSPTCSSSGPPVRSITSARIVSAIGCPPGRRSLPPLCCTLCAAERSDAAGTGNSGESTVRGAAGARGSGHRHGDRGPVRAELVDGAEPAHVRRELLQLLHDPVERADGDRAAHRRVVRVHAARRPVLVQPGPRLRGDLHGDDPRGVQPAAARGLARPGHDGAVVQRDHARLGAALPHRRLGARPRPPARRVATTLDHRDLPDRVGGLLADPRRARRLVPVPVHEPRAARGLRRRRGVHHRDRRVHPAGRGGHHRPEPHAVAARAR